MVKAPVFVKANRNPEMFFVSILIIAICLEVKLALCWMLAPGGQFRCTPVPSSTSAVAPGISLASCCHSTRVRFSVRPKLRLSDFLVISDALWLPQQNQTPVCLNCAPASSHFPLRLATDMCLFCLCSGSSTKKGLPVLHRCRDPGSLLLVDKTGKKGRERRKQSPLSGKEGPPLVQ